jgi:hypothetical protein
MKRCWIKNISIGLFLISSPIYGAIEPAECAILRSRGAGLFSIFLDVLSLLQNYEKGFFKSIKIDFANEGQYFEPDFGQNWWEYYFEPINNQSSDISKNFYYLDCWKIQFCNSRKYNNYLIESYVHLKPDIQEKINSFVANYFKKVEFLIGIHYRGTDKVVAGSEAPRVPYAKVTEVLKDEINALAGKNYLIFIATDEFDFINYLNDEFPGKICVNMEAHETNNNYLRGRNAIIDCVLLSKVHLIIRTDSNLSLVSSFFNYQVPVVELSKGFWQPSEGWSCE